MPTFGHPPSTGPSAIDGAVNARFRTDRGWCAETEISSHAMHRSAFPVPHNSPPAPSLASARVSLVVDFRQVLKIQVGVDLGSADVGMPKKLLHTAQVSAGL